MTGLNVTFKQFPLTVVSGEWNRAGKVGRPLSHSRRVRTVARKVTTRLWIQNVFGGQVNRTSDDCMCGAREQGIQYAP